MNSENDASLVAWLRLNPLRLCAAGRDRYRARAAAKSDVIRALEDQISVRGDPWAKAWGLHEELAEARLRASVYLWRAENDTF